MRWYYKIRLWQILTPARVLSGLPGGATLIPGTACGVARKMTPAMRQGNRRHADD